MSAFMRTPHALSTVCMLTLFTATLLSTTALAAFFLAKAPSPRWRRFARRSLIAWPLLVLLVPAGSFAIAVVLERLLSLLGAPAVVVRLVLYGLFVLFIWLCGLAAAMWGSHGGEVLWRCGWRAIWSNHAEVAQCVEQTERKLAERRRRARPHAWMRWLLAALVLIGTAVLGWFWLEV